MFYIFDGENIFVTGADIYWDLPILETGNIGPANTNQLKYKLKPGKTNK